MRNTETYRYLLKAKHERQNSEVINCTDSNMNSIYRIYWIKIAINKLIWQECAVRKLNYRNHTWGNVKLLGSADRSVKGIKRSAIANVGINIVCGLQYRWEIAVTAWETAWMLRQNWNSALQFPSQPLECHSHSDTVRVTCLRTRQQMTASLVIICRQHIDSVRGGGRRSHLVRLKQEVNAWGNVCGKWNKGLSLLLCSCEYCIIC